MLTYTEPQSSVFCLWNDVLIALSMLAVYLAMLYTLTSARLFLERWENSTCGTKCFLGSLVVCLMDISNNGTPWKHPYQTAPARFSHIPVLLHIPKAWPPAGEKVGARSLLK